MLKNNELLTSYNGFVKTRSETRQLLINTIAQLLVERGMEFAEGETDFKKAMHTEGPNGDHTLIVVEDEVARTFGNNPLLAELMQGSPEWDDEVRKDYQSQAAYAAINEAYGGAAEMYWEEAIAQASPKP